MTGRHSDRVTRGHPEPLCHAVHGRRARGRRVRRREEGVGRGRHRFDHRRPGAARPARRPPRRPRARRRGAQAGGPRHLDDERRLVGRRLGPARRRDHRLSGCDRRRRRRHRSVHGPSPRRRDHGGVRAGGRRSARSRQERGGRARRRRARDGDRSRGAEQGRVDANRDARGHAGDGAVAVSDTAPAVAPKARRWLSWRTALGGGLGIAVLVATFVFVLPRIANYRAVWAVVKEPSWAQIGLLIGATAVTLATYAPPWQAALPGLSFRRAFVLTQASTASTYVLPGGAAVGMGVSYGMLRGWGFTGRPVTLALAVTGIWSQFAMLAFRVVAFALLTLSKEQNPLLQTVAFIGVAILVVAVAGFAVGLTSDRLAKWVGDTAARITTRLLRLIRRGPVKWDGKSFVSFRPAAVGLLKRRW